MKGKKFIAIISIVCILAVILCIPAFATVTESNGDGYALYNGVKLSDINGIMPDDLKSDYPYFLLKYRDSTTDSVWLYISSNPFYFDGEKLCIPSNSMYGWNVVYINGGSEQYRFYSPSNDIERINLPENVFWSNHDIINSNDNSVYLAASNPIFLDGMSVIEWDGDITGLQKVPGYDCYYIATVDTLAVDAFTVMELSYSATPVVVNGFHSVGTLGWLVDSPVSSYKYSAAAAINDNHIFDVAALKFDDVDDTGYTSLIAYRTVEEPPGEGGDTPDEPQPPFGAIEIYHKLHLFLLTPQLK